MSVSDMACGENLRVKSEEGRGMREERRREGQWSGNEAINQIANHIHARSLTAVR